MKVISTKTDHNKATVTVNIYKGHRQTIKVYLQLDNDQRFHSPFILTRLNDQYDFVKKPYVIQKNGSYIWS